MKDGRRAVISNEDKGTASVVDLASGEILGEVKVSEEPEGVAVNPANGQVYITCEEKGEVYVIDPDRLFSPAHFKVGARPRSAAFLPDGSRAYVPAESDGTVSVVDTATNKVIARVTDGTKDDVDTAVAAAKKALPAWKALTPHARALAGVLVDPHVHELVQPAELAAPARRQR